MKSCNIPIKTDLITEEEEDIICKFAKERIKEDIEEEECSINVFQHTRVYRSRTKVFRIQFNIPKPTKNYIIKITDKELIENEYKKWDKYVKEYIKTGYIHKPKYSATRGALLYEHVSGSSTDDLKSSRELKDILFDQKLSFEKRLSIIDEIFDSQIKIWNEGCDIKSDYTTLLKEYQRPNHYLDYLRGRDSDEKISKYLGDDYKKDNISICGYSLKNPLNFIDRYKGFNKRVKFKVKNLHGDMHPRNVIIDKKNSPHLIDFEWAHRGHALKDYLLMECSIKFFYMPRPINLKMLFKFEKFITNFQLFHRSERMLNFKGDKTLSETNRYIRKVRNKAKEFNYWESWEKEYLSSLFLVTYGLLKFEECDFIYALFSLGCIADRLEKMQI